MTIKELQRANEIDKEITELEGFLYTASKVWRGKLILEKRKVLFVTIPYGWFGSKEYELNPEAKNEMLKVLQARLIKLKKELFELGLEVKNETL